TAMASGARDPGHARLLAGSIAIAPGWEQARSTYCSSGVATVHQGHSYTHPLFKTDTVNLFKRGFTATGNIQCVGRQWPHAIGQRLLFNRFNAGTFNDAVTQRWRNGQ